MRINDKIEEIETYLEELNSVLPFSFEEYKKDFKIRAICERYFEKIIEGVIDLGFILIKDKKFEIPEEERKVFEVLFDEKIISEDLFKKLRDAKGMRNIIAHEYGEIDDKLVFEAVTEQLIKDIEQFLELVKRKI